MQSKIKAGQKQKERNEKMKRAIKLTAAALGTAGFMLVTAAGVLCRELPDTFYIGAGERL